MDSLATSLQNMQRYSMSPHRGSTFPKETPKEVELNSPQNVYAITQDATFLERQYDRTPSYVVVSGGTAANDFVHAFGKDCAFVLPVSDDGGSSSEILRVLGGPAIGDIRSRLIRLIPTLSDDPLALDHLSEGATAGTQAVHDLFAHRFPTNCTENQAKGMWADLVEGKSSLWTGVPADRRECIRSFLVHFNTLILKRSHKHFSFRNCSVGNAFLAAARDMLGGLPGAIFMFRAVSDSQKAGTVLPVILTNQRITIAARLENGFVITGQCEISHPAPTLTHVANLGSSSRGLPATKRSHRRKDSMSFSTADSSSSESTSSNDEENDISTDIDYSSSPVSTSATASELRQSETPTRMLAHQGSPWRESPLTMALAKEELARQGTITSKSESGGRIRTIREEVASKEVDSNALYTKGTAEVPLPSRIQRVFYINDYGQEIKPDPNSEMLQNLATKQVLVYSCGSLWTSIVPCLTLKGVGSAVARSKSLKVKVLLLNCDNDRETAGYTALDYVQAIVDSLNNASNKTKQNTQLRVRTGIRSKSSRLYEHNRLITHLIYLEGGRVEVDELQLMTLGIVPIKVPKRAGTRFTASTVEWAMKEILQ